VPREAAGQGFSPVVVDEAVARIASRLIRDNHSRPCPSGQDQRASTEPVDVWLDALALRGRR